jgi:hypothetical protein
MSLCARLENAPGGHDRLERAGQKYAHDCLRPDTTPLQERGQIFGGAIEFGIGQSPTAEVALPGAGS